MSLFDEECPHCDDAPPSRQIDIHIARAHADLPPCAARIETEHRETYRCAFRAGHEKGQYGKWHASSRGNGDVTGRYVWNDGARGATPHRAPEPSFSLDKLKAMGVLSHTIVAAGERAPELEQPMSEHTPWCCDGCAAFCPLCPRQVDLVRCPGHAYSDRNRETVRISRLHANREHPDFEYHTTKGARKQFDASTPPADDEGSPDSTWEVNLDAGRDGWERFDYHEEAYWRRPKRKTVGPCARPECGGEVHTDPWGTPVQCPHAEPAVQADTGRRCPRCDCPDGHEQCDHCKVCPHARAAEPAEFAAAIGCAVLHRDAHGNTVPCPDSPRVSEGPPCSEVADCDGRCCARVDEGRPEAPGEEESNPALPVRPDPRQAAYDAVYEYIRALGSYLPRDPVHRNAVIWRAVHAALGATPVGRCVSSHCVEGDHMVFVEGGWESP